MTAGSSDRARLAVEAVRGEATLRFTSAGPTGSAEIVQTLPGSVEDAINAAAGVTGVTATAGADGALLLEGVGRIEVSGFSRSDEARAALATFSDAGGRSEWLVADRFHASKLTAALDDAIGHMAEQRARRRAGRDRGPPEGDHRRPPDPHGAGRRRA